MSIDLIPALDGQIATARTTAAKLASRTKEFSASLRQRLVSPSGADKQARGMHAELAALNAESDFAEQHLAALQEHRATLVAEAEAARTKAERQAKLDAFKALVTQRDAAAAAAEVAARALGQAVQDMAAVTTEINQSAATVGMKPNIVGQEEIRYGVEFSLYEAGLRWMYAEKPLARYDAQGKPTTTISARIKRSGAEILATLKGV